jgi:tetratricopeptide (TPR) repeat protein
MAKSRPSDPSKRLRNLKTRSILNRTLPKPYRTAPLPSPAALLAEAADHLQTGTPSRALELATLALEILPSTNASLPVLNLLGEIHIELGDGNEARKFFERAIALDPGGTIPEADGGGAERFLWLAQLCDEGGRTSLGWFERGVEALEREIVGMQGEPEETLEGLKTKIAGALCGMVEIWMTDLSYVLLWCLHCVLANIRIEARARS